MSRNHVIAAEDRGRDGDEILHPGPRDGGRKPDDVVGYLDGKYVVLGDDNAEAEADCAFARLEAATECDPNSIGPNETLNNDLATACDVEFVQKIGRTTGRTIGRISALEIDIPIRYSFGEVTLRSQIEIESRGGATVVAVRQSWRCNSSAATAAPLWRGHAGPAVQLTPSTLGGPGVPRVSTGRRLVVI